jgi:hypothetical protein
MRIGVPPIGNDLKTWGEDLRRFLAKSWDSLSFKDQAAIPSQDGIILWDATNQYPVVSRSGEWRQIVLADGFAFLTQDASITAAAADTAYAITFDAPGAGDASGITRGTSPNESRIIFEEGGLYYLSFTAQIYSTSSSQVNFYFWPRINGTDAPLGSTQASLHNNTATKPVTKSAVFRINANDYLQAMWATSSTSGSLSASAATAFSPAVPSASLSITRISA